MGNGQLSLFMVLFMFLCICKLSKLSNMLGFVTWLTSFKLCMSITWCRSNSAMNLFMLTKKYIKLFRKIHYLEVSTGTYVLFYKENIKQKYLNFNHIKSKPKINTTVVAFYSLNFEKYRISVE